MLNKNLLTLYFIIIIIATPLLLHSQKREHVIYKIETKDGNFYIGKIISKDSTSLVFETRTIGSITIDLDFIENIHTLATDNNTKITKENLQDTRYFWAPNGYGLKKREGYYQNVWVLFNQASIGLNNYFSFGAGTMPLFLFAGSATPVWFVPKFSVPLVPQKINVGAGALIGVVAGETNSTFGITYGVVTIGSREANITFGAGWALYEGEWAKNPTYNLNGLFRLSKKGYLISENYFIQTHEETLSLISFGGRTIWPKISLDYGIAFPISELTGNFLAIPWLGFMVPFGS